jgi:[protein-PII] uridylyltransferase
MSDVAQKRDLSDPKTIRDFVDIVQSPERLRLLLCLTVADIRAVGPGVWNGWKGQLLRQLYHEAEAQMLGGFSSTARPQLVQMARAALAQRLDGWDVADRDKAIARHHDAFWLSVDTDTHLRVAEQMHDADLKGENLSLAARVDVRRSATEISIYTQDRPGLFSRLAGAFAMSGANILDAKIFTTRDGMAVDLFSVQDATGQPISSARAIKRIRQTMEGVLASDLEPGGFTGGQRSRKREEAFLVEPQVLIDNAASDTHTVIEVNGRDRPGLLYDLTRALFEARLSIHSAQVTTFGERAVDVFYTKDVFGLKVTHPQRIQEIRERVYEALGDGSVSVPQRSVGTASI